jgi:hypothetical protein
MSLNELFYKAEFDGYPIIPYFKLCMVCVHQTKLTMPGANTMFRTISVIDPCQQIYFSVPT